MTFTDKLRTAVERRHPDAVVSEERFPSGAVWVDLRLNGTLVVAEHRPRGWYAVSVIRRPEGQPSLDGYCQGPDRTFTRYAEMWKFLAEQLRRISRRGAAGDKRSRAKSRPHPKGRVPVAVR